jgi:hypothetical protein
MYSMSKPCSDQRCTADDVTILYGYYFPYISRKHLTTSCKYNIVLQIDKLRTRDRGAGKDEAPAVSVAPRGRPTERRPTVDETSLARNPRTITRHERRECRNCYGSGLVLEDAAYVFETGELIQAVITCPICAGDGSVSVYLYTGRHS